MSKKNSGVLGFLFSIAALCFLGYVIYIGLYKYNDSKRERIKTNLGITIGEIISKHSYKGEGISIKYKVKDKDYITRTGVTSEFYDKYVVGSQVSIKYDTLAPENIMIED
jgi:hypothetical protein